jgi:hypothetical protein
MTPIDFEDLKNEFISADLEEKISLYMSCDDLTSEQYKELLRNYPIEELPKLEAALNEPV